MRPKVTITVAVVIVAVITVSTAVAIKQLEGMEALSRVRMVNSTIKVPDVHFCCFIQM